jgi:hypothetical protein
MMIGFTITEQLLMLLLAGTAGFLFLHSSWRNAYTGSVGDDMESELKAEMKSEEAYMKCKLLRDDEARYKRDGMSKAVWLENAAVLITGPFLVLSTIRTWLAPLYIDTVGMMGMYVASVIGGILITILLDKVLEGYVDTFLQNVRIRGLIALKRSDPVKRLKGMMTHITKK